MGIPTRGNPTDRWLGHGYAHERGVIRRRRSPGPASVLTPAVPGPRSRASESRGNVAPAVAVAGPMAWFAFAQRPPIFTAACLAAATVLLEPLPRPAALDALGPPPICRVAGVRHGELYVPLGTWTMPIVTPSGHWSMPNPLAPPGADTPMFDVDTLVSGLKRMLATPHT